MRQRRRLHPGRQVRRADRAPHATPQRGRWPVPLMQDARTHASSSLHGIHDMVSRCCSPSKGSVQANVQPGLAWPLGGRVRECCHQVCVRHLVPSLAHRAHRAAHSPRAQVRVTGVRAAGALRRPDTGARCEQQRPEGCFACSCAHALAPLPAAPAPPLPRCPRLCLQDARWLWRCWARPGSRSWSSGSLGT